MRSVNDYDDKLTSLLFGDGGGSGLTQLLTIRSALDTCITMGVHHDFRIDYLAYDIIM